MTANRHDVIVIGAGIAGLAAAWDLRDRDIVVIERSERVGGRMRSETRGPHWLNLGAHVFGGDESAVGRLLTETGCQGAAIPGVLTAVSYRGRLVADGPLELYPLRLPISLRARLEFVRVGLRLRRLVADYSAMARPRVGESSAELQQRMLEFMDDCSFTEALGELSPEVDAFFRCTLTRGTGEPEEIAAGYGVGYFHLAWNKDEGLGRNIVGGPQLLLDRLAAPHGDRIRFGTTATRIAQSGDGVEVACDDGRVLRARSVIVTAPAHAAASLIEGLPTATEAALRAITYGPMISAAFLTDESGPQRWDDIYAIATPGRATSMLFNMDNVMRGRSAGRPDGSSFMSYSSANLARQAAGLGDDAILDRYQSELESVFPELQGHVVERQLHRVDPGIPHPFVGRSRIQQALMQPLGRVQLAGDYLGTWYAETAVWSGRNAAATAKQQP